MIEKMTEPNTAIAYIDYIQARQSKAQETMRALTAEHIKLVELRVEATKGLDDWYRSTEVGQIVMNGEEDE